MDLKDIKEAGPIELAEYAVSNKIDDDPYFSWWVHYVFNKQARIIAKTDTKYWSTTHKYGVRLPNTSSKDLELDRQTSQTLWENSLKKDMSKAEVSYKNFGVCTPEEVR